MIEQINNGPREFLAFRFIASPCYFEVKNHILKVPIKMHPDSASNNILNLYSLASIANIYIFNS
jgi:hypothetical protein